MNIISLIQTYQQQLLKSDEANLEKISNYRRSSLIEIEKACLLINTQSSTELSQILPAAFTSIILVLLWCTDQFAETNMLLSLNLKETAGKLIIKIAASESLASQPNFDLSYGLFSSLNSACCLLPPLSYKTKNDSIFLFFTLELRKLLYRKHEKVGNITAELNKILLHLSSPYLDSNSTTRNEKFVYLHKNFYNILCYFRKSFIERPEFSFADDSIRERFKIAFQNFSLHLATQVEVALSTTTHNHQSTASVAELTTAQHGNLMLLGNKPCSVTPAGQHPVAKITPDDKDVDDTGLYEDGPFAWLYKR